MGEVIQGQFGNEREWQDTRKKIHEGLRTMGGLFGDDVALLDAKAEALYLMLREIVENIPQLSIRSALPDELTEAGMKIVKEEIRKAALAAIESTMAHSVSVLMASMYDLCTSKLAQR